MTLIRHGPGTSEDRHGDLIEIFERVLREGGVFEITEAVEMENGSAIWLRVSIAGVDVLKAVASASWRRLLQDER